ncbi:MAG: heme-binding protein [Alphaproteobacteria bacterium]
MTRLQALVALAWSAAIAAAAWIPPAQAQPTQKAPLEFRADMSLALALDAARAAIDACFEKHWYVAATVVDRAGHVKAALRVDGAGPHTLDSSRRKAYTAATLGLATTEAERIAREDPTATGLRDIDGFLLLGGGLPIRFQQRVIGAIGVGGAPGGEKDDMCAEAGIAAIEKRLAP